MFVIVMQPKTFILLTFLGIAFLIYIVIAFMPQGILFAIPKLLLLIVALAFVIAAMASRYYTYMIMPFLKQRSKDIVLSAEPAYTLTRNKDALLHKQGDDIFATVYISIPLYRSSTEMTDEEKLNFADSVSRLVGLSKYPVRFTSELYIMNKDSYIGTLHDSIIKLENEEQKLSQENADPKQLDRVKGQLSMWRNMLDTVGESQSYELESYASVSGIGSNEYEAISIAQQRATELMAGIGSTFGVQPAIVTGDQLLKFLEPEYLIPLSTIMEQISKNLTKEGG
jgi:energy-coupling factor transporter transmembrane protein EcfT